jgi:hypothetical protein
LLTKIIWLIILIGRKPLITNNMMSSMNPFYASWSFMKEEKYLEMAFGITICHLVAGFLSRRFEDEYVPL